MSDTTERFMRKVPTSPVSAHIDALHRMAELAGMHGDALAVFEHHLHSIAIYSHDRYQQNLPPWERPRTDDLKPFPETFNPARAAEAFRTAAKEMTEGVARIRARLAEQQASRSPDVMLARAERASIRKYENAVQHERVEGIAFVLEHALRARKELGL